MGTFLKLTGTAILAIGLHLIASTTAMAASEPASSGVLLGAGQPISSVLSIDSVTPKGSQNHLKGDTYQPPDDIGSPDGTQGSGTR